MSEEEENCDIDRASDPPMPTQGINFISIFLVKLQLAYRLSNSVIVTLLKFLSTLFAFLGKFIPALQELELLLPATIHNLRKKAKLVQQLHSQYAFCPKCYKLYDFKMETLTLVNENGEMTSMPCSFKAFPNHPHRNRRQQCGEPLMKRVKYKSSNKLSFYPRQVYCYCSIKKSISILIEDPKFWTSCNKWRDTSYTDLSDVYSGKVWNEFQVYKGRKFLADPHNLAFMLNVDWFRPFEHTTHSVGVIYITIMNLPRNLRNKFPYVLIVGVIPGPHEPSGILNTFLGPLVNELLELWEGCWLGNGECRRYIRAALLCVSCDLPAARKVGGVVGHSALKGCSKCQKQFPTDSFGEKADYSGFDTENWIRRKDEDQRKYALEHLLAPTLSQQKSIEREHGVKYSILSELPYYDRVRFLVIDPMHLLFLGIAKHTMKTWINLGIINNSHFDVIQKRINLLTTPSTLGRIPMKVASGFSQLTADQWKNWICVFSSYSLFGILPVIHWHCWWLFVQGCNLICKKKLSFSECNQAQNFIIEFCKEFETLYGKENLVINMHLACHLKECIIDYGPIHGFWCFGFERFNGILGSFPNNHLNVSITMMKKFEDYLRTNLCHGVHSDLIPILSTLSTANETGSLCESAHENFENRELLKPLREYILPSDYSKNLCLMYNMTGVNITTVSTLCVRSAKLFYNGHILSSALSRSRNGTGIVAKLHSRPHVGIVQYYFQHNVEVDFRNQLSQVIAVVDWFKIHPDKDLLQPPLEVWRNEFMPLGPYSFLPVHEIICPAGFALDKVDTSLGNETVYVTVPISHLS